MTTPKYDEIPGSELRKSNDGIDIPIDSEETLLGNEHKYQKLNEIGQ